MMGRLDPGSPDWLRSWSAHHTAQMGLNKAADTIEELRAKVARLTAERDKAKAGEAKAWLDAAAKLFEQEEKIGALHAEVEAMRHARDEARHGADYQEDRADRQERELDTMRARATYASRKVR